MIYARLEDPPENIEAEAKTLYEEYMSQFGDEIPEDVDVSAGLRKAMFERGSKELKEYLLKIERIRKEAAQAGEWL